MLESARQFLEVGRSLFSEQELPKTLRLISAGESVARGDASLSEAARFAGTTPHHLKKLLAAPDPIAFAMGCTLQDGAHADRLRRARANLGQLLIGVLAERAFEEIYKRILGTSELRLIDDREARSDTDYLVVNGQSRSVFRVNIKFHGTRFRNSLDLVGLDPEDCFALATYKIYQALQKQEREVLPYVFAVVGVPELSRDRVGEIIPEDLVHFASTIHTSTKIQRKRSVEDRIVSRLIDNESDGSVRASIEAFAELIREAEWRVLSARKADKLLRERLFERVFAVRVRAFARNYANAELDMHFSLGQDLTTLSAFLELLRERGLHGLTSHLERGLL